MVKCSKCGQSGHNKKSCKSSNKQDIPIMTQPVSKYIPLPIVPNTEIINNLSDNLTETLIISEPKSISDTTTNIILQPEQNSSILSISYLKNSNTYKQIGNKLSQLEFYKQNNCAPEICKIVELESKSFGTFSENMIVELFKLEPRTSSQNDGVKFGKKIEIKTARYWTGTKDCKWQHIELDYDYDFIILALLDFNGFNVWGLKKSILISDLKTKNILTIQGKQGYWMKKSEALPYLTPINTMLDFDNFIKS